MRILPYRAEADGGRTGENWRCAACASCQATRSTASRISHGSGCSPKCSSRTLPLCTSASRPTSPSTPCRIAVSKRERSTSSIRRWRPKARTAKVRIELANPDGVLRPNLYGSVQLATNNRPACPLAVPDSAVLDSGARKVVLVESGDGRFAPREVQTGPAHRWLHPHRCWPRRRREGGQSRQFPHRFRKQPALSPRRLRAGRR